jgi:hypoxanthine phosphoribosyltransferase
MGTSEPVRRVISWSEYDELCSSIASQIPEEETPDAIVGLTRGGLVPAVRLSHQYNAKLYCLNISLRDGMVDDNEFDWDKLSEYSNILVVDDINDSGKTLQRVMDECYHQIITMPRFAVLLEKPSSRFTCAYSGERINKAKENDWIVFPWE